MEYRRKEQNELATILEFYIECGFGLLCLLSNLSNYYLSTAAAYLPDLGPPVMKSNGVQRNSWVKEDHLWGGVLLQRSYSNSNLRQL